jgi:PAS domain-containing protein
MMQTLAVQFLDQGFHRVLFNAMPMPVFVVDKDVAILEYNTAAGELVGPDRRAIVERRGGEVLHCLHATEVTEGCGRAPACSDCVVRKAVRTAAQGQPVVRQRARMDLLVGGKRSKVDLRVSCHPFSYEQHPYFLLLLEGLND